LSVQIWRLCFETAAQGPSPKNPSSLLSHKKEKISVRTEFRGAPRGEIKQFHRDFSDDSRLQGKYPASNILHLILALCQGHFDYLEHLPDKLLLKILSYIALQDIGHRSQTSSRFRKLCNSEEIWKQAVLGHCDVIKRCWRRSWVKNNFFTFCHNKEHDSMACPAEEEDTANAEYP
uniref:F-box domain-containing protein n=1 Tax=Cyprinus carpio TaxID=7962 RepID=A0A8C1UHX3_CYPCA